MRTLITTAVGAVALATAFIGNVSAQTYYSDVPHVSNQALQDQLERDASKSAIERPPLGVVISRGDQTPRTSHAQADSTQNGAQDSGRG